MSIHRVEIEYEPHDCQSLIHDSSARFKVLCCGRRFGKTLFAVYEAFRIIFFNYFSNNNFYIKTKPTRGWFVAPTYSLTREIERYFKKVFKGVIEREIKSERRYILVTGDEIEFKSAESGNLVGAGLDWVVIDEAALISDDIWYKLIRPTLTDRLGKGIIISTPRGKNWFWNLFTKGQDPQCTDYESWHFPSSSNPYLLKEEIESARLEIPDLIFRQEYLAQFLDDASSFFRNIDNCIQEKKENIPLKKPIFQCPDCGHSFYVREYSENENRTIRCNMCKKIITTQKPVMSTYYTGIDLGKEADFTVITTVEYHPYYPKVKVINKERFNKISWTLQKERIKSLYKKYSGILIMDGTGLGSPLVDDLITDGIPVEGIVFTNSNKLKMYGKLSMMFEKETIEIPNDYNLINELRAFQAKKTKTGHWKLGAPAGMNDDEIAALALALWLTPPL